MILDAIRESGGTAVAVADDNIAVVQQNMQALEGLSFCPEAAACAIAARELLADGRISAHEQVVIFNTCSALKYHRDRALGLLCVPADQPFDYSSLGPEKGSSIAG